VAIRKDTLDQLLDGRDPKEVFNKGALFDELKKALAERFLNAEIDDHLDGEAAEGRKNHRNGYSSKEVITETSKLDIRIPEIARERAGALKAIYWAKDADAARTALEAFDASPWGQEYPPIAQGW
jgi:putative transposase